MACIRSQMGADIGHYFVGIVRRIQKREEIRIVEQMDQFCHGGQMGGVVHGAEGEDIFHRIVFLVAKTYGFVQDADAQGAGLVWGRAICLAMTI